LEKDFAGQPLYLFFLLFENALYQPPTADDAIAWDTQFGFGDHAFTLLDGEMIGYRSMFPNRTGHDGAMTFRRGVVISAIDAFDDTKSAVQAALDHE